MFKITTAVAAAALVAALTACGSSQEKQATPSKTPSSAPPSKSVEEREAAYRAALPEDLTESFPGAGPLDYGYEVCKMKREGASEGEIINGLKHADPIWMGLYGQDLHDTALTHLCPGT